MLCHFSYSFEEMEPACKPQPLTLHSHQDRVNNLLSSESLVYHKMKHRRSSVKFKDKGKNLRKVRLDPKPTFCSYPGHFGPGQTLGGAITNHEPILGVGFLLLPSTHLFSLLCSKGLSWRITRKQE